MKKTGYNKKSRKVVETIIDNIETEKIQLELPIKGNYDQNNLLVLPSKKRKTKIKEDKQKIVRILSKKHRKRLEKVVEKKEKKENRNSLLEALCQHQATPQEFENLTSISAIQTKGLKRYFLEEAGVKINKKSKRDLDIVSEKVKLNSLSGAKRRQLLQSEKTNENVTNDPNIVDIESDESSEDDDDDDEENNDQENDEESDMEEEEEIKNVGEKNEEKEKTNNERKEIKNVEENNQEKEKTNNDERKRVVKDKLEPRRPAVFVDVLRDPQIQEARLKLPIIGEEQEIMETINENDIVIIAGETGSGKTTQLPQFLYESGYALKKQIAITEPRRVAAIQMSQRVATEMNLSTREVSYLIRFEGNTTDDTKIKFMTDGVLFKEVQSDFLLSKYSVVILDEAHERSVYTDILIGLLSRIVPLRRKRNDPLKLIIMSATLRLEDFTMNKRLFKSTPPVINVETRQFPVTIHFNKRTNDDYIKEAFLKVSKIHTNLPDGGILVFMTGQQEVNCLVKKLRRAFPYKFKLKVEDHNQTTDDIEIDKKLDIVLKKKTKKKIFLPEINLDDYSVPGDNTSDISDLDDDLSDNDDDDEIIVNNSKPLWCLPLYSLLPTQKQNDVFKPPPDGARLCIIATNIAETSLTIPGIKYVVDTGRTKIRLYDKTTGVSNYLITWTSKASANQRAGRAGRLGPGHCYRLYSSAVYNDLFHEFSTPEIQQKPVDDLYLQMKIMNIDKIMNFPFPTAPDLLQLKTAEQRLEILGAIKQSKVTSLGRAIAKFPVLPRFGKMLALSHQYDLLPYTICLVAALSVQEVLLETPINQLLNDEKIKEIRQKWSILRRKWAGIGNSYLLGDNMVLLCAVGAAEYANSNNNLEKFCHNNGLRHKAVIEIRKLRLQLTNEIKINIPDLELIVDPKLEPPTDIQAKLLRQILLSGMGDQIARKITWEEIKDMEGVTSKAKYKYAYQANNMEQPVFLHSGSVLRKTIPEFVIYHEIYEIKNKIYMRGCTAIEPEWLPIYVPKLCNLSEPLMEPEPKYHSDVGKVFCSVSGTFGSQAWPLPVVEIEHPITVDCYKWFGKFLLEGKIFDKLDRFVSSLLSQPSIIVKSWAKLQPRCDKLLKKLIQKEINNKMKLEEIWSREPNCLLEEYLLWVPESAHTDVQMIWPPI